MQFILIGQTPCQVGCILAILHRCSAFFLALACAVAVRKQLLDHQPLLLCLSFVDEVGATNLCS